MRSRAPFWVEAMGFLLASVAAAVIANAVAGPERKLKWIASRPAAVTAARPTPAGPQAPSPAVGIPTNGKAFPPHPDKAWIEISGDDTAELHARKTVPFLDARRTSVYRDGHIAGARPFSVWEADIDDKVKAFFAEGTDQSAPIVVYCSGGNCEDSHMLSDRLYQVGFDNVLVYKDGYPDWVSRGLPVTKGAEP